MKQPFRYFRGEFSTGKYLYALVACPNFVVKDIIDELVYHATMRWKLENEINEGEMPIRDKDIHDIARIAGFFLPQSYIWSNIGSIYFSPDHIENGEQRSERGLYDVKRELFKFIRTQADDYQTDITDEANKNLRATFIPEDMEPIGYIHYDTPFFDEQGNIIPENLFPAPPSDPNMPYTPFYGEQFLVHEEFFHEEYHVDIDTFLRLFECLQRIRYNGPSIKSFMEITALIGEGYIYDVEVIPTPNSYIVNYKLSDTDNTLYRIRKLMAWQYLCEQKFKLFILNQLVNSPTEED